MKSWKLALALACIAPLAAAENSRTLVFSGYIDYPARHDYRIEVSTFPSGLISRVATYSGEPRKLHEEMLITQGANGVSGIDRFQQNIKSFEMTKKADAIRIVIANENTVSRAKKEAIKNVRIKPGKDILFDDEGKQFVLLSNGDFRVETKADASDVLLVRKNQILNDGWYRSDWKRAGSATTIQEFTTMELPGDWISDGGGVFTGNALATADLDVNIFNYYILDIYLDRPIFIPFVFGLRTGTY